MNNKELRRLSLAEAQSLITKKELSPVELVDAYLERIDETEDTINSFTAVYAEAARKEAKALEEMQMADHFLGPLHGIPVAVKDNIALAGHVTTGSSIVYEKNIPGKDAPVAARLKSAGAVLIGKTNMHEFAWGATTDTRLFGASCNPWDPVRFCCGSSGGSGGSIANATSLAALGTDTGGSVRLPSSVCGIVGMRPTIGRVPLQGIIPLAYTLDACGPMTRNVKDNAIMLNTMAGYQATDPSASNKPTCDYTGEIGKSIKNMRIGILPEYLFQQDQPDVIQSVKKAFDVFKDLGAELVECKIDKLELMAKAWYAVCATEASTFHQKNIRERPQDYGEDVRTLLEAGEFITGTAYVQAQRYRRWLREQFLAAYKDVDCFLFPTLPATAVPIGQYDLVINGKAENILPLSCNYVIFAPVTGMPALSIPCGQDHDGMPIGMQILGKPFGESTLYRAGAAFESVYSLHSKLPGLN